MCTNADGRPVFCVCMGERVDKKKNQTVARRETSLGVIFRRQNSRETVVKTDGESARERERKRKRYYIV